MRRVLPTVCARLAVLAVTTCALPATAGAVARPGQAQSPPPTAYIVVNTTSGDVLEAGNEHEALPPASTAKIMTALTAIERLSLDATINVTELAAAQPASRINMVAGHQWPFADAMASLLMASANDAAYAIAETAGGSLQGFADAMAETADSLGMQDSTFADPAGFDDEASFGGGPRMSAFDIAIATRNALATPEIAKWAALRTYEFVDPAGTPRSLTNHNRMLAEGTRAYEGTTGFKTGFTNRAGQTFVATATRNGCSLIVVILNTYDVYGWAAQLMDQHFLRGCAGGTGARLPEVRISPHSRRVADRDAFAAAVRGDVDLAVAPVPTANSDTPAADTPAAAPKDDGGGGGVLSVRTLAIGGIVGLAALVGLRRRAVKRQRARRLARQRTRAARMRSGGLPIVDGKYRAGTRVGPPVESHVQLRRARDDELADR
ncbi:MAG: D-alanyl-D-alanine carboxypeptidase family protein [Actinomycetota bacterium]